MPGIILIFTTFSVQIHTQPYAGGGTTVSSWQDFKIFWKLETHEIKSCGCHGGGNRKFGGNSGHMCQSVWHPL